MITPAFDSSTSRFCSKTANEGGVLGNDGSRRGYRGIDLSGLVSWDLLLGGVISMAKKIQRFLRVCCHGQIVLASKLCSEHRHGGLILRALQISGCGGLAVVAGFGEILDLVASSSGGQLSTYPWCLKTVLGLAFWLRWSPQARTASLPNCKLFLSSKVVSEAVFVGWVICSCSREFGWFTVLSIGGLLRLGIYVFLCALFQVLVFCLGRSCRRHCFQVLVRPSRGGSWQR